MNFELKTVLFDGTPGKPSRKSRRGPGRPTREEAEKRNEELLDRALELFLERGFEGTTIEAITESIGMSSRTVYLRYGDKLTLYKAALQGAIDDWFVPPEQVRAMEVDSLEQTLLRIARLMIGALRKPSGMRLMRTAKSEAFRNPEIATYLWERTIAVTVPCITELFQSRLWPDNARQAEDAALAFLILVVEGSVQMLAWGDIPDEEFDRQIDFRTGVFLRGIESLD